MTQIVEALHGMAGPALLAAWENAAATTPLRRGPAILAAVLPDLGVEPELLSLGARDTLLLSLRVATFGAAVSAVADCPTCAKSVDVEADGAAMLATLPAVEVASAQANQMMPVVRHGSHTVEFRLPDTRDVLAATASSDPRRLLASRCVLRAVRDDVDITAEDLPADVLRAVGEHIAAADPAAELQLRVSCPECGSQWSAAFDVPTFFWSELDAAATGLLLEVDALAARYGWSEQAILSMSPARRSTYLDMP